MRDNQISGEFPTNLRHVLSSCRYSGKYPDIEIPRETPTP